MANSTDPLGKQVFGGQTSIPGQTSTAAATSTTQAAPWKSYHDYFAGNPEAQKWQHYQTNLVAGTPEAEQFNQVWNSQTQNNPQNIPNPWQFGQEYNKYTSGLPQEYQTLIGSGIDPSAVSSGAVTGVVQGGKVAPLAGLQGAASGGSGSSSSLAPDVLAKMWR